MNNTAQAIKEVLLELKRPASSNEIKKLINEKYPNKFKEATLNAHFYACSVNNRKAYLHGHKGIPKILYRRDDGKYELYDLEKHGEFSFNTDNNQPKKERTVARQPNQTENLPFLIIDNQGFNLSKPRNEAELEHMVKEHSKLIFGNDSAPRLKSRQGRK
jgi:hypothetical protein